MINTLLILVGGIMLLVKGADYLVEGASSLAKRFGVPSLVIGLTVVAFGTSAPEFVVNMIAAVRGNAAIALGNINGSNIVNILLAIGLAALITRIPVRSRTVLKEIPFMLLAGISLLIVVSDVFLIGAEHASIDRIEGLMLLGFFGVFLYYLFLSARDNMALAKVESHERSVGVSTLFTVMGLAGLIIGAKLTVDSGVSIASALGVSEGLIGLTFVAIGTSLPEIVASISAARKGEMDLAVGGIIGSNIFNIFLVIGATAAISPVELQVGASEVEDAGIALIAMLLLFGAILLNRWRSGPSDTQSISRLEGVVFVTIYVVYLIFTLIRG